MRAKAVRMVRSSPFSRRFHRKAGEPLRPWERALFLVLYASHQPEIRLWANVLADALYTLYRFPRSVHAREALAWICSTESGSLHTFVDVATALGLNPEIVRRDVLQDCQCQPLPLDNSEKTQSATVS
jgi:hypothetical protein